jgi:Tfp pilus assembly protein PilF
MRPARTATKQAEKRLQRALALHQQGKLAEAEQLYRDILARSPQHFEALHHLGVLKCQQSSNEEGTRLISAALQINPSSAAGSGLMLP